MRKRVIALLLAVAATALMGPASPASACSPGPSDDGSETVHVVNPASNGRNYLGVDGDNGTVKAGVTSADENSYLEVQADTDGNVIVHGRNTGGGTDGRYGVENGEPTACPAV